MGGDAERGESSQPERATSSGGSLATDGSLAAARALTMPPRAAMLVLVPLGVIALGLITPPVIPDWLWPYSAHVHLISPYEDGASWMWSIQIVAVVLAAITLVDARRRSAPGVAARIVATIGTLAVLHLAVVMLYVVRDESWPIALTSAVVVVATLTALVQAFRTRDWRGWLWALAAYAIAALPYACPLWPGIFNEFSGGLTFVAGDVTLLVLALRGLRDQQRR